MRGLLIITKTVDENDQLLGFFIGWLREFAKRYDKINILCLEKGSFSLPDNVRVTSLGKDKGLPKFMWLLNLYKQAWKLRKEYNAVFVHMNAIYVVMGAWLWFILGKKVFLWYAHKTITWQHRVAEKFAEGIFASTLQGFRLKTPKLHIVGQGIDTGLFRPTTNYQLPTTNLKILSVGRIAPIKNYESLIGAVEILDKKGVDVSVTIIGAPIFPHDVEYENKIKEIIKSKKLDNKIMFVGKVSNSNLPPFYRSHQIYINLSRTGSLDKTIVEAMASGCAVLSSNDSAREFLPAELIIADNDPIQLAAKIIEVKDKDYGVQLRECVIKNHSIKNLIDKMSKQMDAAGSKKILITGHPYAFPYYFKVFEHLENKNDVVFVLPKLWLAKKGKIRIKLESRQGFTIFGLRTLTYGGHGLAGLFKGWLPGLIFLLPYLKNKYKSKVLYSCSEPNLLTTLCNGLMAKICGMKYVFFTWQNIEPQKYMSGLKLRVYTALVRFNLRLADGVICGNKKAQKIVYGFQFPVSRTMVCPLSGVDTEKFRPFDNSQGRPSVVDGWREKLGVKPEEKLILFYGALDKRKGLNVLIDAFYKICNLKTACLPARQVNCKLLIVGTGPELENLKLQITNYKLQTRVIFLDWLPNDELPGLLNASDVFIYPSVPSAGWEEQFGYAMAEASACSVPVVATRTGSIDEVVQDGKSGLLVESNNPEQLADGMAKLAGDEGVRKEMGRAGREFVLENYSHNVVAHKLYDFFQKLFTD